MTEAASLLPRSVPPTALTPSPEPYLEAGPTCRTPPVSSSSPCIAATAMPRKSRRTSWHREVSGFCIGRARRALFTKTLAA